MKFYRLPIFLFPLLLIMGCKNTEETTPPILQPEPIDTATTPIEPKEGIKDNYGPERGIWQKPEIVISLLGDISQKTVADIGAGTGFFAKRLTPLAEKVIAIDIDPFFIRYLDSIKVWELPKDIQYRLETRQTVPSSSSIEDNEVDIVMIVNTYIYLPKRVEYLKQLRKKFKDGGQLLIINFKKKRLPPIIKASQKDRVPLYELEQELIQAGYRMEIIDDTSLDYQYIVLASA